MLYANFLFSSGFVEIISLPQIGVLVEVIVANHMQYCEIR